MSLARRSVTSAFWKSGSSLINALVLFGRSILLARWLPVEVFGVYSLAGTIVSLSVIFVNFGFGAAFLHRSPETADEGKAAETHFTLKSIFSAVWLFLILGAASLFAEGEMQIALIVIALSQAGLQLASTPAAILSRRVLHRRLAVIQLVNVLLTTGVALPLAYGNGGLWALLATDIVTVLVTVVALYVWKPVWLPRFSWSRERVSYFLRFGSRALGAALLVRILDQLDDLWTGVFLGDLQLGFYSRAYRFATYPRSILASPISDIASGMFAELKEKPKQLSQAFFRVNGMLVRAGFLFTGVLALIAPEFIRILLGAKWLPMLDAFRLMLVFALLEPLKSTVSSLFIAVGEPERIVKTRLVQLLILVSGLFLFGTIWGIEGVALSVTLMGITGMVLLLFQARLFARFSVLRLFAVPAFALIAGMLMARLAIEYPGVKGSDWRTGAVKVIVFIFLYGSVLLAIERKQVAELVGYFSGFYRNRRSATD